MNKKSSTKRTLITSALSMVLCMAMLIGTTFAWFTDTVTSKDNIIQAGKLDAELNYKSKLADEWTDASKGTIFNYDKWEPGYVDVKYVQVANAGNLAFRYLLNIVPETVVADGEVDLADVIDVYVLKGEQNITRESLATMTKVGTLASLMEDPDGAARGILLPEEGSTNVTLAAEDAALAETGEVTMTIALKMQESAGNEYQESSVGEGFRVELLATQYTWENDSFDNTYDAEAVYPVVNVNTVVTALAAGEDVLLGADISKPADIKAPYGNLAGLVQKGGTFDGGNNTLSVTGSGDTYGVMTYGGTIKNLTIDNGFRGIVLYAPTEDVILDNVEVCGEGVVYALNTAEHPTVEGIDLIVTNSKFCGWTSFAGLESASFTKCEFGQGLYYDNVYGRVIKPYINTTFTDCTFTDPYYLDLSGLGTGCKVTLDNCTMNGTVITAQNYTSDENQGFCIELPEGRTLEDCVIFK